MIELNLTPPEPAAAKLRAMLAKGMVVCPGVYDGITARLALNAGFEVLYMVSSLCRALPRTDDRTLDWSRDLDVPTRHS